MTAKDLALPGNPRYQPRQLEDYFGYDNLYKTYVEVEIAALRTLIELRVVPEAEAAILTREVEEKLLAITTSEADKIEREVTKHDIRALVRLIQEQLGPLARWVHVPLTSYDVIDTGRAVAFVRAHSIIIAPRIKELISVIADMTERFAGTLQIGRTHCQHALPITVGFWLASILYRIHYNAEMMEAANSHLVGKISGAVGAYNAQIGLGFQSLCADKSFEERVLEKLGLRPAPISTQILPPEPLAYYLHSCTLLSAAFGQLGRDARNLMRSELGEIAEPFESGQVGSSTMAHKRNPINFENVEGMWLRTRAEYLKDLDTMISDHQRDLTGSCIARDFPIILVNLVQQLNTLLRSGKDGRPFLARIAVDEAACERNFHQSSRYILAEPLYIAMQMAGYAGDAHEFVNHGAMPISQRDGISLWQSACLLAEKDPAVCGALSNIPQEVQTLLQTPERYTGSAHAKAIQIAVAARAFVSGASVYLPPH